MGKANNLLHRQTGALLENAQIEENLFNNVKRAMSSGAINHEKITDDSQEMHDTAKAVFICTLENIINDMRPHTKEGRKTANNLRCFI